MALLPAGTITGGSTVPGSSSADPGLDLAGPPDRAGERQGVGIEINPDLVQGDVRHHRAGAWRKIEREHQYPPAALSRRHRQATAWLGACPTPIRAPAPTTADQRRSQPAVTVAGTGDTYHILFAILSASVSNSSSATFCASMTSPVTRLPSGKKHQPHTRRPFLSSWSIFIERP